MASLVSFSLLKASASTPTTTVISPPPLSETLDQKFGRKGIKFSESGDIPATVELTVRNGSSLKLQISNGHISSYRPKVYWKDDGYEEVLHTLPGSRGGVGLAINDLSQPTNSNSAPEFTVKDVDSDSIDALQVELSSTIGSLDISYVVSLYPVSMATAVIVKNNGRKAVSISSGIMSHFGFKKKRNGSGVQGLNGCSYCTSSPPFSPFQILSPSEAIKPEEEPRGFFSSLGWEPEIKPGVWTVQDVPITVLKNKLSRVYAPSPAERSKEFHRSAPSKYEIIDQGRGLFYRVIRMGYEEIYLSSPGMYSDKYGDDYFICTGPASIVVPVTVNPGEEWRGAQVIEHDNL